MQFITPSVVTGFDNSTVSITAQGYGHSQRMRSLR
jgi:hypothetical protein